MKTLDELRGLKAYAMEEIRQGLPYMPEVIDQTDERIRQYLQGILDEGPDLHNLYEVLAGRRFLELAHIYEWKPEPVQKFIKLFETLKLSGLNGRQSYKLTPIQTFQFAHIYGFHKPDGRRLVRQVILFMPRKFSKTTGIAVPVLNDFLNGPANSQAYIAANSADQSALVFNEVKKFVRQLDPNGAEIRCNSKGIYWKDDNSRGREAYIEHLTAGGRTKDGLNANIVVFDEYAAARYVRGRSEGADLLNVLTSSMGTRPEPLTIIITTASKVIDGPFENMLRGVKAALTGEEEDIDWRFAHLCCPDPWDLETEDYVADEKVWRKCNPHIGVTVQPDFYALEYSEAKSDPEKMKEFKTKYLNVFTTEKAKDWIKERGIRRLMGDRRVYDLNPREWLCWIGCDFSKGDDLCVMTYNCYNPREKRFFWDACAWIAEDKMKQHTLCALYERWVVAGLLHVCPGSIINEADVLAELDRVSSHVNIFSIGYDAYDSMRFINLFRAWIVDRLSGRLHGKALDEALRKAIVPVSQTWASFNASTQTMYDLVYWPEPVLEIADNEMIPFNFASAVLKEDEMGNCKPVKLSPNSSKIDIVIGLLMGIIQQNTWDVFASQGATNR